VCSDNQIHLYTEPCSTTLIECTLLQYSNRVVIVTVWIAESSVINGRICEGPLYYDSYTALINLINALFLIYIIIAFGMVSITGKPCIG